MAKMTGDYSAFPEELRDLFPAIEGEICQLRDTWGMYEWLFMDNEQRTKAFAEKLGPLLAVFQNLLEDQLFLGVARLTDKDPPGKENLSIWVLRKGATSGFASKIDQALEDISSNVKNIRTHRHKRIGHFDRDVSLKPELLPQVTFEELRVALEKMENFLNLFHLEFDNSTMLFDSASPYELTICAEATVYKAKAYDELEKEGEFATGEWERRAEEYLKASDVKE